MRHGARPGATVRDNERRPSFRPLAPHQSHAAHDHPPMPTPLPPPPCYVSGEITTMPEARISPFDRGFHLWRRRVRRHRSTAAPATRCTVPFRPAHGGSSAAWPKRASPTRTRAPSGARLLFDLIAILRRTRQAPAANMMPARRPGLVLPLPGHTRRRPCATTR